MTLRPISIFREIFSWAKYHPSIHSIKLTGVRTARSYKRDILPDYQFTVFVSDIVFIENDSWLKDIAEYFICFYDQYIVNDEELESRLVVFANGVKIHFLFRLAPPMLLNIDRPGGQRIEYIGRSVNRNSWQLLERMLTNYN